MFVHCGICAFWFWTSGFCLIVVFGNLFPIATWRLCSFRQLSSIFELAPQLIYHFSALAACISGSCSNLLGGFSPLIVFQSVWPWLSFLFLAPSSFSSIRLQQYLCFFMSAGLLFWPLVVRLFLAPACFVWLLPPPRFHFPAVDRPLILAVSSMFNFGPPILPSLCCFSDCLLLPRCLTIFCLAQICFLGSPKLTSRVFSGGCISSLLALFFGADLFYFQLAPTCFILFWPRLVLFSFGPDLFYCILAPTCFICFWPRPNLIYRGLIELFYCHVAPFCFICFWPRPNLIWRGLIKIILVHSFNSLALLSRPPAVLFSFGLVAPTCFIFFGLAAPTCFIFIWPTVCFIFTWPRGPDLFYFFLAPTDLDS